MLMVVYVCGVIEVLEPDEFFLQQRFQMLQEEYWDEPVSPKNLLTLHRTVDMEVVNLRKWIAAYSGSHFTVKANAIAAYMCMTGEKVDAEPKVLKFVKKILKGSHCG